MENPSNGRVADARPVDWGPNISTGRVADLSPGLAKELGLQTDDVVRITISALRAIPVKPDIFGHNFTPGYSRPGGTSCPDKLFGPVHSQATIAAWVAANV